MFDSYLGEDVLIIKKWYKNLVNKIKDMYFSNKNGNYQSSNNYQNH